MAADFGYADARRWDRLKSIFSEALRCSLTERPAYLAQACGEDHALRAELESLLAAHDTEGVLDSFEEGVREMLGSEGKDGQSARRIGPYALEKRIGDGGMGVVYAARRVDGQFDQRVAIKLIRLDVSNDDSVRRFLDERRILARLNHPGIARLFDGGVTEDGRPYFAMEFVEGERVDHYCARLGLNTAARLQLFLKVCDAIHYAHQSLVIHRDLKPANILVTEEGGVKLLDFGIAKLLDPDGNAADLTRTGVMPMTPAYASPEQVRREPITTATDVYQLGALLYELLTGVPPFRTADCSPMELLQVICEDEPLAPSEAVINGSRSESAADLQAQLRGDLDTIVCKALRKEPEQRYASADRLAGDIRRFVDRRPIEARSQTWRYRASTFVKRNQLAVATVGLIALLLVSYLISITWYSRTTTAALHKAELETQRAQQVSQFLFELFEASDPASSRGDTITARDLLEQGLQRVDRLASQPVVQAQMLDIIGRIYVQLGDFDKATSVLEQALHLRTREQGSTHIETANTRFHLGAAFQQAGRYDDSLAPLENALRVQQGHYSTPHPAAAKTLVSLGAVYRLQGDVDRAKSALLEALQIQEETLDSSHPDLSETLNLIGLLYGDLEEWEAAENAMRRSVAIRRERLGESHPQFAKSLNNLGMLLRRQEKLDEAETAYLEALSVKRRLFGSQHPSIASTLNGLGLLLKDAGRLDEAREYLTDAYEMRRSLLGRDHPFVAGSLTNLGYYFLELEQLEEAERSFSEARDIFQSTVGPRHVYATYATVGLARVRLAQRRNSEATSILEHALVIRNEAQPADHPEVLEIQELLEQASDMGPGV